MRAKAAEYRARVAALSQKMQAEKMQSMASGRAPRGLQLSAIQLNLSRFLPDTTPNLQQNVFTSSLEDAVHGQWQDTRTLHWENQSELALLRLAKQDETKPNEKRLNET
jgi:hypothetical protein